MTIGIPGATSEQSLAIEFALRMFDPVGHDGLRRSLAGLLDAGGFSDQQMQTALLKVLVDCSGIYIPSGLLPQPMLSARLSQSQRAQTTLAAAATLAAAVTTA